MIINFHSIVDVITNSSTTIYTGATDGAVELVTTIINEVLRAAGSNKTADDLYYISVVKKSDIKDDGMTFEEYDNAVWDFDKGADGRTLDIGDLYGCGDTSVLADSYLSVIPKTSSDANDLAYLIAKIFFVEERYE